MARKPAVVQPPKCLQCPIPNHCHKSFGPFQPITSKPTSGPPTPDMASLSQIAFSIYTTTKGRVRVTPPQVARCAKRLGLYNSTDQTRTRITLIGRVWKRQQSALLLKDAVKLKRVLISEETVPCV